VTGVARLNGTIYVACKSKRLFLYTADTLVAAHPGPDHIIVHVEGGRSMCALDIVACSLQQCLYVADLNNRCVLRILVNEGRTVLRWLERTGRSFQVSLTPTLNKMIYSLIN